ncbi:MAG: polyprenyl synthetase family protein [Lachnospiraceae bacterium]|nr:polyprenyl synthetase family protein [Lachnospiraceae bacterium]
MKNEAFAQFYKESFERLTKAAESYNREIQADVSPLLSPFREDFADLNSGGKLLRGTLVNLGYRIACRLRGKETEVSYSDGLALAFELFQTGVLIHDDVIDKADTRRGKPTANRRYEARLRDRGIASEEERLHAGISAAVCLGDFGLYLANRKIVSDYASDLHFPKLMAYFDDVILDTIRGELLDVVLPYELQSPAFGEAEKRRLREQNVMEIYRLKTARYSIVGPLHLGMILGGAEQKEMEELDSFAENLGIAFQIKDDILGIFADAGILGKDVGSDIAEKKQTILSYYVENERPDYAGALMEHYGKADVTEETVAFVQSVFRESGALRYAEDRMEELFLKAEERLGRMDGLAGEDREALLGLTAYLRDRRK